MVVLGGSAVSHERCTPVISGLGQALIRVSIADEYLSHRGSETESGPLVT